MLRIFGVFWLIWSVLIFAMIIFAVIELLDDEIGRASCRERV